MPFRAQQATSHFLSAVCRFTGVLLDVQKFFQISDSNAGLLQTGKEQVPELELWPRTCAGLGSVGGSCPMTSFGCCEMRARLSPTKSPGRGRGTEDGGGGCEGPSWHEKEVAWAGTSCLNRFECVCCAKSRGAGTRQGSQAPAHGCGVGHSLLPVSPAHLGTGDWRNPDASFPLLDLKT